MKRTCQEVPACRGLFIFATVMVVVVAGTADTNAQMGMGVSVEEAEKRHVLKSISEHKRAFLNLKAKVKLVKQTSRLGIAPIQRTGSIKYVAASGNAPSIFRVDLKEPPETLALSSDNYNIYAPKLATAFTGKINNLTGNANRASLVEMLFLTPEDYLNRFRSVYLGKTTINGGVPVHQLVLTPLSESSRDPIELWVDLSGMPIQVRINEKNGDSTTLSLSKISYNKKIDRSKLAVKFKKDTKVVREESPIPIAVTVRKPVVPTKPPAARLVGGSIINSILARMDEHNKVLKSLRASVTMVRQNAQLRSNDTTEGEAIYLPVRGKIPFVRIDWIGPRESLVVVNKQYLIYRPGLSQTYTGLIDRAKGNARAVSALAFMGMTRAELKVNYTIAYLGDETTKSGVKTWHLQITPKTSARYRFADIWVDGSGMPIQFKVNEHNGESTTVLLSRLQKNVSISPSEFKIELPAGTKIIKE